MAGRLERLAALELRAEGCPPFLPRGSVLAAFVRAWSDGSANQERASTILLYGQRSLPNRTQATEHLRRQGVAR